ncbi:MAG: hypothetical protein KDD70_16400, partial [Bdellovibrionales bacterium]|nr:hypothetical protein [Bdellovibrionales bacterium]
RRWAHPLAVLGGNALAVYLLVNLLRKWIFGTWTIETDGVRQTFAKAAEAAVAGLWGAEYAQLAHVAFELGVGLVIAYYLWFKRLHIRL